MKRGGRLMKNPRVGISTKDLPFIWSNKRAAQRQEPDASSSRQGEVSEDKKRQIKENIDNIMGTTGLLNREAIKHELRDKDIRGARYAAVALNHLEKEWSHLSGHTRYKRLCEILKAM